MLYFVLTSNTNNRVYFQMCLCTASSTETELHCANQGRPMTKLDTYKIIQKVIRFKIGLQGAFVAPMNSRVYFCTHNVIVSITFNMAALY